MVSPLEIGAVGWGIAAAGWIISPYITRLVNKASSHVKVDDQSRANLHKLVTQVIPRLKIILQAADGTEHKELFEELVSKLKSAFRDTEDILSELEYIRLHDQARQNEIESPESAPSNQLLGPSKDDLEKNIKNIEEILEEARATLSIVTEVCIATGGSNLPGGSGSDEDGPNASAKITEKQAAIPTGRVTGRDDVRDRIMRTLENDGDPSSRDMCLSVIGIHGIPGSGKTTLAQYIFKSEETAGYFDIVMWIHVSKKFSMDNIFSEMVEQAGKKDEKCPGYNSLVVLQNTLKKLITGKRFLLVLDDIWCSEKVNEQKKLQRLIPPLMAAKRGSKILVTSRHKDALSELGPEVRIIENSGIPELDDDVFLELLMHNAFGHRNRDFDGYRSLLKIGTEIAQKLRKSPLLASVVGGMLYKNHDVNHWRSFAEAKILDKYMGPLWWCYQHLNEQARRCFAYCSIFPRSRYLYRDELVNLWVAEGFITTTNEGWDMEHVGQGYFDELLSVSFLLPGGKVSWDKDYFLIHDLLYDLAEMVAGSDCFKVENASAKVPSDVRHLSIERCSASMIAENIIKLKTLRTLIIFRGEDDVNGEVLGNMFMELTKLRVLILQNTGSVSTIPGSVNYLKLLHYLGLQNTRMNCVHLPCTIGELYLLQVLDLEFRSSLGFKFPTGPDVTGLTNLRHVISETSLPFPNIGRLTSLQTMPPLNVERGEGYELQQLGDLNNLRGKLVIQGLGAVNSKEEALRAKLADKRRVTSLSLNWYGSVSCSPEVDSVSCSPEVDADVFEGLRPPEGLECMNIYYFTGSRYPEWMFGREKSKMELQRLELWLCSKLVPAPVPELFFIGVTSLKLYQCDWDTMPYNMVNLTDLLFMHSNCDALPDNMDQLTSLRSLTIGFCWRFRRIPALPASLQCIKISYCHDEFTTSCKDEDHPNYKAIENIPEKHIGIHFDEDSDQEEDGSLYESAAEDSPYADED